MTGEPRPSCPGNAIPPPSAYGGTRHGEQNMNESRCHVTGMTCGHCVASVTEEAAELPGVNEVEVGLPGGSAGSAASI
ncbi:heavy-metal-associated domain-containing protein [Streptomyces sp. NBC_00893]|uniref:heavy-metal-associated domain-containing protein n=1 Tax=Streptomyces sp. NBC_00893 TaxID=2975862 RepID=UPI00338E3BBE